MSEIVLCASVAPPTQQTQQQQEQEKEKQQEVVQHQVVQPSGPQYIHAVKRSQHLRSKVRTIHIAIDTEEIFIQI